MLRSEEKEIGGAKFRVQQFPVLTAIRVSAMCAVALAPVLEMMEIGTIVRAIRNKEKSDTDALLAKFVASMGGLKPKALEELCAHMLSSTFANGVPLDSPDAINLAFLGREPMDVFLVMWFVLEVNHFFGLAAIGKPLGNQKAAASAVKSKTT